MVRDSNSGHQLLLPPANWWPIFALPDHAGFDQTQPIGMSGLSLDISTDELLPPPTTPGSSVRGATEPRHPAASVAGGFGPPAGFGRGPVSRAPRWTPSLSATVAAAGRASSAADRRRAAQRDGPSMPPRDFSDGFGGDGGAFRPPAGFGTRGGGGGGAGGGGGGAGGEISQVVAQTPPARAIDPAATPPAAAAGGFGGGFDRPPATTGGEFDAVSAAAAAHSGGGGRGAQVVRGASRALSALSLPAASGGRAHRRTGSSSSVLSQLKGGGKTRPISS